MEGYMENAQGHQVPVEQVKEIDKLQDELVMEAAAKVKSMKAALTDLRPL